GIHAARENALEPVMHLREVDAAAGGRPARIIAFSQVYPFRARNTLQSAKGRGPHARLAAGLLGREERPAPVFREIGQVQVRGWMRVDRLMLGGSVSQAMIVRWTAVLAASTHWPPRERSQGTPSVCIRPHDSPVCRFRTFEIPGVVPAVRSLTRRTKRPSVLRSRASGNGLRAPVRYSWKVDAPGVSDRNDSPSGANSA